jgi:hypothetical protein
MVYKYKQSETCMETVGLQVYVEKEMSVSRRRLRPRHPTNSVPDSKVRGSEAYGSGGQKPCLNGALNLSRP